MALKFFPRARQLFVCDLSGFNPPEMTKIRPVVVISPRLPYRSQIATVVPISLTEPLHNLPFVVRLSKNYHPLEADDLPCWAKCDMVLNLSLERLSGFKIDRRKFGYPTMNNEDFQLVRAGVLHGLGYEDLINPTA